MHVCVTDSVILVRTTSSHVTAIIVDRAMDSLTKGPRFESVAGSRHLWPYIGKALYPIAQCLEAFEQDLNLSVTVVA